MKAVGILTVLIAMLVSLILFLRPGASPEAGTPQNAPAIVEKAKDARDVADLAVLKGVIQNFQAEKERLPVSLDELKELGYINQVPVNVVYDPASGALSVP